MGIELAYAEMKGPVKDKFGRFVLFGRLGPDLFFAPIGEAVGRQVETFDVNGVDGQDREA